MIKDILINGVTTDAKEGPMTNKNKKLIPVKPKLNF